MSLAAVFDSAGTLMKTVRAVFSVKEQAIRHDAETTLLVFEDKDRSLVLLNAGYTDIFRRTEDLPLSAWIAEQNISYAVSCGKADSAFAKSVLQEDKAVSLSNLQDTARACLQEAEKECEVFAMNTGAIINSRLSAVEYLVAAAGYPFPGVAELMHALQQRGIAVYIASGDRQEKLEAAGELLGIQKSHVFGAASPERKAEVVRNLQEEFNTVIMTGDAVNDLPAFRQADYAVLTLQQRGRRPDILFDAVDEVIEDIRDVEKIAGRFA